MRRRGPVRSLVPYEDAASAARLRADDPPVDQRFAPRRIDNFVTRVP
jgi:hypothetical protein